MKYDRVYNFSAGPATLPESVLEQVRDELLNYNGAGMSVMEMSHRSKDFDQIIQGAEEQARQLLSISDEYSVLFLQGGATQQFAMVPYNFYRDGQPIDFVHTGSWTKKALKEAQRIATVNVVASTEEDHFLKLPQLSELKFNEKASYVHMCSNNTIFGTKFSELPKTPTPLVADMSSEIFSRPIDVNQFGLIFAGAQKNIGPSGVTLVIVKKEWAEQAPSHIAEIWQYRAHIKNESRYNTPPTFGIYIAGLVLNWVAQQGGVEKMEALNQEKASVLYHAINSTDFYTSPVPESDRSDMNVVFRVQNGNDDLEAKFVSEAKKAGLSGLKGHRSVGGLRASIYNAFPLEGVKALADFMSDFEKTNG